MRGVSSGHVKKRQGRKGDQIKPSPDRSGPWSSSQASASGMTQWNDSLSPSKKQRVRRVEEGCRQRNSPAAIDRPKRVSAASATSGSNSESQERRGLRELSIGYLGASGGSKRSIRGAWINSEDEVESERGGSEGGGSDDGDGSSGDDDFCRTTKRRDIKGLGGRRGLQSDSGTGQSLSRC